MRKRQVFLLICVLFLTSIKSFAPNLSDEVKDEQLRQFYIAKKLRIEQEKRGQEFQEFLTAIGLMESGNNPRIYNRYGYIGKYQFGYAARKSCGYGNVKFREFTKNPSVWSEEDQDAAMITLLSKNESHLKDVIHKYNGKQIKGVVITKSGILAAAHLAGAGGVKKYFAYNYNPKDAYGTRLEDYLIKFSGFNF